MKTGPKKSLPPGTRLVGVNMEPELRARLQSLARNTHTTMSTIVRRAVCAYLNDSTLTTEVPQ